MKTARIGGFLSVLLSSLIGACWSGAATAADEVDFNRDVRPILARFCLICHGPDDASRQAGLRLDLRQGDGLQTAHPGQFTLSNRHDADRQRQGDQNITREQHHHRIEKTGNGHRTGYLRRKGR